MKTHKRIMRLFAALLVIIGTPLLAQYRSTVSETVTDSKGGLITNAAITIVNTQTGTESKTISNSAGLYSFPGLTAGTYELRAESPTFQRFTQSGIVLELSQTARIDIQMSVGNVTTTVTVNENASPLNFDTITQGVDISPDVENKLPVEVN